MSLQIVVDYSPSDTDNSVVSEGIIASNAKILGERDKEFSIFLKDSTGKVLGGLQAYQDSESIYIDTLWIPDTLQNQGYGSQLLHTLEQLAINSHCKYITVDTFAFQAEAFYLKHGYTRIGAVPAYWLGHSKLTLRKMLQS